MGHAPGVTHCT